MSPPRTRQGGFVLVLVLAMLVILSILATTVALTAQRLREEELDSQRLLQAELDMADTRASVIYLLLTQRRTFGGLTVDDQVAMSVDEQVIRSAGDEQAASLMPTGTEIRLDATPHRGLGDVHFALQDDRGRLSVNWAPPAMLARYVQQAAGGTVGEARAMSGADAADVDTLLNLLKDYQDPDDLYRLNSAERDQYVADGRPPPTNRHLATPLELRRVKGWDEALAGLDNRQLIRGVATVRSAQLNINTAPASVLMAVPGVDAAMAGRIVDARALQPFTDLRAVYQVVGAVPHDEAFFSLYPMDSGTLELWSPDGGPLRVMHWTLTPFERNGAPWREDYEFALPQDERPAEGMVRESVATVLARPQDPPD